MHDMKELIILKIGGSVLKHPHQQDLFAKEVAKLYKRNVPMVIVHGGGPHISIRLKNAGMLSPIINGYRQTHLTALAPIQEALFKDVNVPLRCALQAEGVPTQPVLTPSDLPLSAIKKSQSPHEVDLGFVGCLSSVCTHTFEQWLADGLVPVIPSMAVDSLGQAYNINADEMATDLATHLHAKSLIMISDTDGVYLEPTSKASRLKELNAHVAEELIQSGIISAGMLPKVEHCLKAIEMNIQKVIMINGTEEGALQNAYYGSDSHGTQFKAV